jgi:molecular chaperone GrpE (heat shock protein)
MENDSTEDVSRVAELEQKLADSSRTILELKQEISRLKKKDEQEKQTLKKISLLVAELIQ